MKRPPFLVGRNAVWNVAIFAAAACALLLNFVGLIMGITIVIPHLLYIPVVLAAYRYPKRGLFFAGCIGGIYLLMVVLITGGDLKTVGEALVRTIVVVVIGWLISILTLRLREQEALYQVVIHRINIVGVPTTPLHGYKWSAMIGKLCGILGIE